MFHRSWERLCSPVLDVEQRGVVLLVLLLVQRSHLHSLRWRRDDVILPGFSDAPTRPDDFDDQAHHEGSGQHADRKHPLLQRGQVGHERGDPGAHGRVCGVVPGLQLASEHGGGGGIQERSRSGRCGGRHWAQLCSDAPRKRKD